jgi:hypothetical protein
MKKAATASGFFPFYKTNINYYGIRIIVSSNLLSPVGRQLINAAYKSKTSVRPLKYLFFGIFQASVSSLALKSCKSFLLVDGAPTTGYGCNTPGTGQIIHNSLQIGQGILPVKPGIHGW